MGILALATQAEEVLWAQKIAVDTEAADYMQVGAICKAISLGDSRASHVVVFKGIAKHLPALQVFFRTNHFRVLSYICIDEFPTGQLGEWPDAPVAYLDTEGNQDNLNLARLRNWQVITTSKTHLQEAVTSCAELFEQ